MLKMNIHKALSTKKLLEKRIDKVNDSLIPLGYKMKSSSTEYSTRLSVDDFNKKAQSSFEKSTALIHNYNKICQAITLSNSRTEIEVNGQKMTVSDAINRKNNIDKEEQLLNVLKKNYKKVLDEVKHRNDVLEEKIDTLREIDIKEKIERQSSYEIMRESESWEMVDPLNILKIIDNMEKDIMEFKSEVDFVLSTSNAQTIIEIDIDEV